MAKRNTKTKAKSAAFDRGSPVIVIRNASKQPDAEVRRIVRAVQRQVDEHFFPLWGWRARLVFEPKRAPKGSMTLIVKGKSSTFDGYHVIHGIPVGYVFTLDEKDGLLPHYSVAFSHEVLEMIADPGANLYAYGHYRTKLSRRKRWAFVSYEVCDAVQETTYRIDGVEVSDFVTPEWFEPERTRRSVRFSQRRAVHRPFELAPGGYMDVQLGSRLITVDGPPLAVKKKRKKRRHRHAIRREVLGLRKARALRRLQTLRSPVPDQAPRSTPEAAQGKHRRGHLGARVRRDRGRREK